MDNGHLDQSGIDNVCSAVGEGGMGQCPDGEACLRIYMNPMYDALTFDYIGAAFVTLFQVVIQQNWTGIMYLTWDAFSFWSWPYFVLLNLLGPMFAVQLFLVVVANQYSGARTRQREMEKAAVELFEVKVGAVTANLPHLAHGGLHTVQSCDSYVVVTLDEKKKQTRVIRGSFVPEWNEYFVFPVSSPASCARIDVFSWRRKGAHDYIGGVVVPVGTLDQSDEGTDRWYEMSTETGSSVEGSVRIRTQWRVISGDEWSPLPEVDDEDLPEEEDEEDDELSWIQKVQVTIRAIAESRALTAGSILVICANMLAMAADHNCDLVEDGYCRYFKAQLEQANLVFTSFFAFEMVIKLWGLGVFAYFKDISNTFDCFVVVISLVELPSSIAEVHCYLYSAQQSVKQCDYAGGALSILRSFRLVRILRLGKLVELFPQIRRQIKVITRTLGAVSSLVILILMYMVIFAILGMSTLGGRAVEYLRTQDPDNIPKFRAGNNVRILVPTKPYFIATATLLNWDPCRPTNQYQVFHNTPSDILWPLPNVTDLDISKWHEQGLIWLNAQELEPFQYSSFVTYATEATIVGLVPRGNFDSFYDALISVFQVFTTSDLGDVLYPSIRGTGMYASLYFVAQILLGNLLLFNLFTGIIITGFSETKDELQKEDLENQKMLEQDKLRRAQSLARGLSIGSKGRRTSLARGMSVGSNMDGERCSSLESAVEKLKAVLLGSNKVTADDLKKAAAAPESTSGQGSDTKESKEKSLCNRVVTHRVFEGLILLSIMFSSASLAMQRPNMSSFEHKISTILDIAVGVIFLLEAILKIAGLGFYLYIGSRWNQLDFFLVITTWIDLLLTWFSSKVNLEIASS